MSKPPIYTPVASQEDVGILTKRPSIGYEPPPQEEGDEIQVTEDTDLTDRRTRAQNLINGYQRVAQLADALQKKVDDRVQTLGGLDIVLDPVRDFATVAAIKRRFPTADPTKITYAMYKSALACAQQQSSKLPLVSLDDIKAAKQSSNLTDFGGLGAKPGQLRPEISNPAAGEPFNAKKFQESATLDLFKMMEKLISGNSKAAVNTHELSKKHPS